MAFLIKPDPEECCRLGIASLGHIPGIWSDNWEPEGDAIDYLIAKGTGQWSSSAQGSAYATLEPLSQASMLAIGYDLTNFLDWCDWRQADWRSVSYGDLVEHHQGDMASGAWSRAKEHRLSPGTINRRVLTAADFLTFTAKRGDRGPFAIEFSGATSWARREPGRLRGIRNHAPRRNGKVRQHPKHLRLPTIEQTARWLNELKRKHGVTPYLMAKTIVGLGLRAEETLLLRVSQLPKVPSGPAKTARMEICYGAKGGRNPNDPEKRGKTRYVRVSVDLLKELHGYRTAHRRLCLKKFEKNNPGKRKPRQLFLSKHTGNRLSYSRLYELWKSPWQPFEHFSPHIGRHMWSCYTLVEKIREEVELSTGVTGPLATVAASIHQSLVETWISPQLGHVDKATSDMYLNWVADQLDVQSHHESWWDFLNG